MNETSPLFVISVAAELAGMHPQTLRQYDRLGLVSPTRTAGKSRRYSMRDVVQLREIAQLSSEGVSLEGIRRVLGLEDEVSTLRQRVRELEAALADEMLNRPGRRVFAAGSEGEVVIAPRRHARAPRERRRGLAAARARSVLTRRTRSGRTRWTVSPRSDRTLRRGPRTITAPHRAARWRRSMPYTSTITGRHVQRSSPLT